ncbi:MAG: hypothetical protein ACK56F_32190 [bacterium]
MAQNAFPGKEKQNEQAKSRYLKYFMIDFLEFNMRKILVENTSYCSNRCHVFEGFTADVQPTSQEEK